MRERTLAGHAPARIAGVLLFAAGFVIWMGIITAEALYPEVYTTAGNEISDLGSTRPPDPVTLQPSAGIFDVTMIVTGAAILVAAWFVHRAFARGWVSVPLGLLGLGVLGIGVFPGNVEVIHPLFAMLAFVAGGIAAIAARRVTPQPFRTITVALGTIALGVLAGYALVGDVGAFAELGDGGVERWVAYPTVAWLMAFGGYLTATKSTVRHGRDVRPGDAEPPFTEPPVPRREEAVMALNRR
jgi:hypothetical membrane protein